MSSVKFVAEDELVKVMGMAWKPAIEYITARPALAYRYFHVVEEWKKVQVVHEKDEDELTPGAQHALVKVWYFAQASAKPSLSVQVPETNQKIEMVSIPVPEQKISNAQVQHAINISKVKVEAERAKQQNKILVGGTLACFSDLLLAYFFWPVWWITHLTMLAGGSIYAMQNVDNIKNWVTNKTAPVVVAVKEKTANITKVVSDQTSRWTDVVTTRVTQAGISEYLTKQTGVVLLASGGLIVLLISVIRKRTKQRDAKPFFERLRKAKKESLTNAIYDDWKEDNTAVYTAFGIVEALAALCMLPLVYTRGLAAVLSLSSSMSKVMRLVSRAVSGIKLVSRVFSFEVPHMKESVVTLKDACKALEPDAKDKRIKQLTERIQRSREELGHALDKGAKTQRDQFEIDRLKSIIAQDEAILHTHYSQVLDKQRGDDDDDDDEDFEQELQEEVKSLHSERKVYLGLALVVAILGATWWWLSTRKTSKRVHVLKVRGDKVFLDDQGKPVALNQESRIVVWQPELLSDYPDASLYCGPCEKKRGYVFRNKATGRWIVYDDDGEEIADLSEWKNDRRELCLADRAMYDDLRSGYGQQLGDNFVIDPHDYNQHDHSLSDRDRRELDAIADDLGNVGRDRHSRNVLDRAGMTIDERSGQVRAKRANESTMVPEGVQEIFTPPVAATTKSSPAPASAPASSSPVPAPLKQVKESRTEVKKKTEPLRECRFGENCHYTDCRYQHPKGWAGKCPRGAKCGGTNLCPKYHGIKISKEALHGGKALPFSTFARSTCKVEYVDKDGMRHSANGVVVTRSDGSYIQTCKHEVDRVGADTITTCTFQDGSTEIIVGYWIMVTGYDVALGKCKQSRPECNVGPDPEIGEVVFVVGYDYKKAAWCVNAGKITAKFPRDITYQCVTDNGYSGCGVYNCNGQRIAHHTNASTPELGNLGSRLTTEFVAAVKNQPKNTSSSSSQ